MTTYIPVGPQTRVNGARSGSQSVTSSAALEDGGYVVVWVSLPGTGYLFKGQRYDSTGNAVGSEFQVASLPSSNQSFFTSTTGLQDGGFVVAWENGSTAADGSGSAVQAQRFDASGQPVGSAFLINELTVGNQNSVALTTLADGSFVAAWTTNQPASGGTLSEIKARLFDSTGTALGSEFLVNTTIVGGQMASSLTAIQTGGFLATWISGSGASGILYGQFFDSAGAKLGGEIALAGAGPGYPLEPSVTELADGRIVVAWRNAPDSGFGQTINGRVFDSSGAPLGSEFLISNPGGNPQIGSAQVKALPDGGFVATWSHPGGTDVSTAVWARIYDSSGTPGSSFLVNTAETLFENDSRTLVTNAGDIVTAWSTSFDPNQSDVSARFIALNRAPVIQSDGGGATAAFTVGEDQLVVTQVVATDQVGPAPVGYAIAGGADAALFAIDSTGHLTFLAAPDAQAPADSDLDNVYEVVVSAGDGELADTQALSVTVAGTGRGLIIASSAQASALENAVAAARVSATDGAATFAITGGADAARFAIDSSTGLLTFVAAPNFEAPSDSSSDNVYDVEVTASAAGQSVAQTLSVTVANVNEGPAFTTSASSTMNENGNSFTMAALDTEGDAVTYRIVGGADADKMSINAVTGVISFYTAPNFEAPNDIGANGVYDVIVRAADGELSVTQAFAITIANVNEGAMISSNGGGATGAVTVAENQLLATIVTARDNPVGTNITYAISGGFDSSKFTIDAQSGVLTFVATPNFEIPHDIGLNNVYDVVVSATDGTVTDTQALAITVSNVNEPISIVSAGGGDTAAFSLPENGGGFTVVASDQDSGTPSFTIIGGADAARFQFLASGGKTGWFGFVASPNYEAPADSDSDNVYELIVQVSDGLNTDEQAISITVADVNETVSITSHLGNDYSFSLAENQLAATIVTATDPENVTISYSISGGADASKFAIDSATGALSFVAAPDYEQPTDAGADRTYDVIVRASDGVTSATRALAIRVTNLVESFAITSHGGGDTGALTLNEGAIRNFVVTTNEAANLTFSLTGADAARFTIQASSGGSRTIAFASADYETPADADGDNVYDVVVTVSGGGYSDSQMLAISVGNVNEAPVITSGGGGAAASVSRAENGLSVTIVAAADPEGAPIVYSIFGGADSAKFTIDSASGALSFIAAPDFEAPGDSGANNVYDVTVRASDGAFVDTQAIAVAVTNVAEGGAVITSNGGGDTATVSIVENGVAVTNVAATGAGAISYAIAGGVDAAKFVIDSATGALSFVAAPNFEVKADVGANGIYDVVVRATDSVGSDTQAIAVTVTNVNESPVITSNGGGDTAAYSISENSLSAGTVTSTDPENTARSYSIIGGADASKLTVNSVTGALSFIAAPNFEAPSDAGANRTYDVVVRASDGVFFDTQAIAITILNVNEAPVITSNGGGASASLSVSENMTAVATVMATDVDSAVVTYSISGGSDASKFTINASTGALSFATAPNFEVRTDVGANGVYDVIVRVSDGVNSDTQSLAITVANVNEAPVITSHGGGPTAAINLNENNATVAIVTSTDPENTVRTYSIAGGADAHRFTMSGTGVLSFLSAPDHESPNDVGGNNVYEVVVRASDGALEDSQAIAVTIVNLNEAPQIVSNGGGSSASLTIVENGTSVTQVVGVDPEGTTPVYSISGGLDSAKFAIHSATGVLTFVAAPNFEAPTDSNGDNLYYVLVKVADGVFSDIQTLAVTVVNANESPIVTSDGGGASASLQVDENSLSVTTVQAGDVDGHAATYAIAGGADAALFSIDLATGALSFLAAPDYEAPADADGDNVYQVTVSAGDGSLFDLQDLSVSVGDLFEDGGEDALLFLEPMPRGHYLPSPLMVEHFV